MARRRQASGEQPYGYEPGDRLGDQKAPRALRTRLSDLLEELPTMRNAQTTGCPASRCHDRLLRLGLRRCNSISAWTTHQPQPKAVGWMPKLCGLHLHELALRARRRNGQTVLLQPVDVKFDSFAHQSQHFLPGLAHRHASGQIRSVCPPACLAAFDNHHVAQLRHSYFSCLACSYACTAGGYRGSGPLASHRLQEDGSALLPSRCSRVTASRSYAPMNGRIPAGSSPAAVLPAPMPYRSCSASATMMPSGPRM